VVSAPVPAEETVIDMVSPLDKLRLFAATLDEAKQTEIAPIIIALDEVINKPEPEPEPEDETPVDSTDYDSTANDETAKETGQPEPQETEKEADAQPPVAQEPSPEVVAALAEVQELKEKLSQLIDSINEYFEEQKRKEQEEVPNLVLSRVTQDSSNVITSREEVKAIKAQNNDDGAVHSMAAAILKTLGGTQ
jgi:molecular chaperone GrpE (heat shock protein)